MMNENLVKNELDQFENDDDADPTDDVFFDLLISERLSRFSNPYYGKTEISLFWMTTVQTKTDISILTKGILRSRCLRSCTLYNSSNLSDSEWKQLCDAIAKNNSLIEIETDLYFHLVSMGVDRCRILIDSLIRNKHISRIIFIEDGTEGIKIDNEIWTLLRKLGTTKKLEFQFSVSITFDDPKLIEFLSEANIDSIDFAVEDFPVNEHQNILLKILSNPFLKTIGLKLESADVAVIKKLSQTMLQNKSLVNFKLDSNIEEKQLLALLEYIRSDKKLESFHWDLHLLGKINRFNFNIFRDIFKFHPSLKTLKLQAWETEEEYALKERRFSEMMSIFRDSKSLSSLELHDELQEGMLDPDSFEVLCGTISSNRALVQIDLSLFNGGPCFWSDYSFRELFYDSIFKGFRTHTIRILKLSGNDLFKIAEDTNSNTNYLFSPQLSQFLSQFVNENEPGSNASSVAESNKHWTIFCRILFANQSYVTVDLSRNQLNLLTNTQLKILHSALKSCATLTDLNMSHNKLDRKQLQEFEAIPMNNVKGVFIAATYLSLPGKKASYASSTPSSREEQNKVDTEDSTNEPPKKKLKTQASYSSPPNRPALPKLVVFNIYPYLDTRINTWQPPEAQQKKLMNFAWGSVENRKNKPSNSS